MTEPTDISPPEDHEPVHITRGEITTLIRDSAKAGAKAAIDEAKQQFIHEVGIGVLRKLAWIAGAALLAIGFWLANRGELPK
jgi:hypothetical protein